MADTGETLTQREPHAGRADLVSTRLRGALGASELERLTPYLRKVELQRDTLLFDCGEDVTVTHLPCHATMISLLVVAQDGQEVEVANVGREGAVGGIVSAGFKPAYGRAIVRAPGFAFCIPTARLEDAKNQSPVLADLFARYADVLLAQMMQSTACNALHGVEQRYCRWLLSAHDRSGAEPIRLTQETLAQMMGVQRTTVTAVARTLQENGVIASGRGRIEILNRAALEKRACECHDAVERHFQRLLPEVDTGA